MGIRATVHAISHGDVVRFVDSYLKSRCGHNSGVDVAFVDHALDGDVYVLLRGFGFWTRIAVRKGTERTILIAELDTDQMVLRPPSSAVFLPA